MYAKLLLLKVRLLAISNQRCCRDVGSHPTTPSVRERQRVREALRRRRQCVHRVRGAARCREVMRLFCKAIVTNHDPMITGQRVLE